LRKHGRVKCVSDKQQEATVRRWQSSGFTQREFCRREGILEWQLSDWKWRILRAEAKQQSQNNKSTGAHNTFAPVTVVGEEVSTAHPVLQPDNDKQGLEIIVFRLPSGSSESMIREVVTAVVSKC
jgi:hypothetical protein